MPFVQDATTPTTAIPPAALDAQTTAAVPTAVVSDSTESQSPPVVAPSDAKESAEAKTVAVDAKSQVRPEAKAETQPPSLTITKSETVTKPLTPESPIDATSLWMWLPLVIAMGLWLYLRGRNQAAQRARSEALLAAASKKSKKSPRSQSAEYRNDENSGSISKVAGERSGKGNSKKNKKDKQQQKKKQQQVSSSGTTDKSNSVTASTALGSESSKPRSASAANVKASSTKATDSTAAMSANSFAATPKTVASAAQPAKAIFEPLRKITAAPAEKAADFETDESDDQDFEPFRKRRASPPPPVITSPAKVSGGRFEKLNLPPANAGLGTSASRWPVEAAQPVATVRAQQPTAIPQAASIAVQVANADSPSPPTARGLAAFVKVARPAEVTEPTIIDSAESQTDSSSN
jgi:hypothetical protein